ncbi:SDR family NAD(P)-dependent oxidoreductase [Pendulispora rubella]|uniref:SDR family NAD(P)-dependent oxidoreductase n=2 Tax=Pendulispora rubella TaxID=2741070 RepID=A0ABZ2KQB4_9BACT
MILNVSSGVGIFGMPALSVYCASKFALEGFSEALAYELRAHNITVKILEPGGVLDSNFRQRLGAEVAHDPALTGYDAFMAATQTVYDELLAAVDSTSDDIASWRHAGRRPRRNTWR